MSGKCPGGGEAAGGDEKTLTEEGEPAEDVQVGHSARQGRHAAAEPATG